MKYDQASEMIGFLDQPIEITTNTPAALIYAFAETKELPKKTTTVTPPKTSGAKEDKRYRYFVNLDQGGLDILGPLELKFERKPIRYDTSKIYLADEKSNRIPAYTMTFDSTILRFQTNWIPGAKYSVIIAKDFAEDTLGNKTLRNDTLEFETKKESDYGSLTLRILSLDTALHPVLLMYKSDVLTRSVPLTSNRISFAKILPGDYEIRVLFDTNGNGIWDPGNYKEKKQPELVKPRKEKLTIRPNWDNEVDINLQEVQNQN